MSHQHILAILGRIAAAIGVGIGAILGWMAGPDTGDLGSSLGDALAGALTGGTVVVIAALTVRWVNAIADRRDKAAGDTIDDHRELIEDLRATLTDERTENERLRSRLERLEQHHHPEEDPST